MLCNAEQNPFWENHSLAPIAQQIHERTQWWQTIQLFYMWQKNPILTEIKDQLMISDTIQLFRMRQAVQWSISLKIHEAVHKGEETI